MSSQETILFPRGFKGAALSVPIRKPKLDFALLLSTVPAAVAGVFTQNHAAAAPILLCREHLHKSPFASAVLINSGNANACTGNIGMMHATDLVAYVADALKRPAEEIWMSSTGVIGQSLPVERMLEALPTLIDLVSEHGSERLAEAIMTTDLVPKAIAADCDLNGIPVRFGAIAKGSGMIAPNMATMLAFVTTDAAITPQLLQRALTEANERSFNRITVDGDQSTNDMVMIMANGLAGNPLITEENHAYHRFKTQVTDILTDLAKKIVRDGEGATKFVELTVQGAPSESDAVCFARSVAESSLVKTALHGEDANWGRIMAALGYAGPPITPESVEIRFGHVPVLEPGLNVVLDEAAAKSYLSQHDLTVVIDLHSGNASATVWTCDLSSKYIEINGSYRS